ncbi:MAG: hypothetical protein AB2794_19275 [Candidatus Thiodiazotropha endolucinida]
MNRTEAISWIREKCGEGWLPLVVKIYDNIPEDVEVTSVYQKWGALMFDAKPWSETLEKIHDEIEEISLKTCEICGSSAAEHEINGWIHTRCETHAESQKNA